MKVSTNYFAGLLKLEEGRKVMFVPGEKVPLTVQKSDGGYTYDTSDISALKHRVEDEKGDWLIYVVDSGQSLHLESAFKAARLAGYASESVRIDHVGFGVVLGEDKKKFKDKVRGHCTSYRSVGRGSGEGTWTVEKEGEG